MINLMKIKKDLAVVEKDSKAHHGKLTNSYYVWAWNVKCNKLWLQLQSLKEDELTLID